MAFVNHYICYARKELAEFSPFIFHSLYRIETKRVTASKHAPRGFLQESGNQGEPGQKYRLSKLTGYSSYYQKIEDDLKAKCKYFQNPEIFYTFSCTNRWEVTRSSVLSQQGYDIWHKDDELKWLTGTPPEKDENVYFAHIPDDSTTSNCPFHSGQYYH